jgi:hypothetical protein
VPITYFFSGLELDAIVGERDRIAREFEDFDIVGAIAGGDKFIDPRHGYNDAHKSEMGGMTYNHIPFAHPFGKEMQGEYLEGFVCDQVIWTRNIASEYFRKTIVSVHPPDGIYAPSSADCLRDCGMDSVVVSSETFGSSYDKGRMYWGSGLRHVVRTNDLQLNSDEFQNAGRFIEAVESYANDNGIEYVTVGCDIDEFNGQRNMSAHDGIARLCGVGQAALGRVNMININASAYRDQEAGQINDVWGWDDVHAMMDRDGGMGFMDLQRNSELRDVILKVGERYNEGLDVSEAKDKLRWSLDAACRNRWCSGAPKGHYDHFLGETKDRLGY